MITYSFLSLSDLFHLACACMLSRFIRVQLFVTVRTVAYNAPLSIGFSRQEYWSGLPFPPPGDLPNTGIKFMSLKSPALAGRFFLLLLPPEEAQEYWRSLPFPSPGDLPNPGIKPCLLHCRRILYM